MGLLLADLRMLANLPASPAGRRALFGTLVGLCLLGLMSWWIAAEVALRPRLLAFVHDQSHGDSLRGLLGAGLMPCPIAATWLGLALAQRQLFESGELGLWRVAPLPPWRPALQILLRAGFVALCWALALSGPFVVTMLQRAGAPPLAYLLLPLVLLVGSLPLLASLLAAQIVLVRFCSGRWLRLILALLAAIASVGFSTWLLLGLFQNPGARMSALAATAAAPDQLPWTIDVGAALLAAAARGELAVAPLLGGVGWLLGSVAVFTGIAHLHPGALEQHDSAGKPLLRFWRSRWHGGPARLVRKKEFAQVLQQPGALLSFLVFGFLVFALARQRVFTGAILGDPRLPEDLASYGAMLALWFLAVLLVLYALAMLYVRRVLAYLRSITPLHALRGSGLSARRYRPRPALGGRTGGAVIGRLAWASVRFSPGSHVTVLLVALLATVAFLVPIRFGATARSAEFVTYMGIGAYDLRVDLLGVPVPAHHRRRRAAPDRKAAPGRRADGRQGAARPPSSTNRSTSP